MPKTGSRLCMHLAVAAALIVGSFASLTLPDLAQAQEAERRWERHAEPAYDDMNIAQKAGSNLRTGVLGLVDSVAQGFFSGFAILSPWGGSLAKKVGTFVGDVVGLVDDNIVTEHVTRGILSRQLLRFGAGAGKGITKGLGVIHDTEFSGPEMTLDDYVGERYFHTRAYVEPSALAGVGAVVISNFIVRPVGSIITIFGARETGEKMHEYGLDLIDRSLDVNFL